MKKNKTSFKIIFSSMIIFQLLFLMFAGFTVAEKNTRMIGFADYSPWFIVKNSCDEKFVKFKFMDRYFTVNFSKPYENLDRISKNVFYVYQNIKK